ncbi:hypothetical protein U1Q18_030017, partial [Sarracenia purpurea var. burkii]
VFIVDLLMILHVALELFHPLHKTQDGDLSVRDLLQSSNESLIDILIEHPWRCREGFGASKGRTTKGKLSGWRLVVGRRCLIIQLSYEWLRFARKRLSPGKSLEPLRPTTML